MADAGESIRALLLDDATVVGLVGARIIPDALEQGETIPAITYRVLTTRHEHEITGAKAGMAIARITVDCYAATRRAANQLSEAVRLSGILDWYGDAYGVDVRNVNIDSGAQYQFEQNSEGSHELRYITTQDYQIHYLESV